MLAHEINACLNVLQNKGTILYPTDTIWGLGCNAVSDTAVEKIFRIKGREHTKSLLVLVSDIEMLRQYVKDIPPIALELMAQIHTPLTIIYPQAIGLAKHVTASDGSIGIRIPKHEFCTKLIQLFGKPIISTSANFSGEPSPQNFEDISDKLKKEVDYTVNLFHDIQIKNSASSILKLTSDNQIIKIR